MSEKKSIVAEGSRERLGSALRIRVLDRTCPISLTELVEFRESGVGMDSDSEWDLPIQLTDWGKILISGFGILGSF